MAGKTVRARTLWILVAAAATAACGGQPTAGPSPVTVAPPPGTVTAPAARALPAGLDPDYVRALATVNADGVPQRWTGGAFHHCFAVDSEQELAYAQTAASRITEISGIQTTDSGPCNVEWVADPAPGHTFAELHGDYTGIIYVKVFLRGTGTNSYPIILHEAGHVLGLNHSPRGEDLMNANTNKQRDFSRDELAVLAWIYGR